MRAPDNRQGSMGLPEDSAPDIQVPVMQMEVDSQNFLRTPNLHDGYVVGIHMAQKNFVRISVVDVSGRSYAMDLLGLRRFRCDGFAEGNIILSVEIISGAKPCRGPLVRLLGEVHPTAAEPYRMKHERWRADCSEEIARGSLTLVEIAPSYGCEILALCESVKIESVEAIDLGGEA